mmetsp:Transcript_2226/g.2320  ORF Transcript_2226/g.2320 Transcript_2226/m.2320 type:complete len:118 (-) Transcript_2226:96-449(-)
MIGKFSVKKRCQLGNISDCELPVATVDYTHKSKFKPLTEAKTVRRLTEERMLDSQIKIKRFQNKTAQRTNNSFRKSNSFHRFEANSSHGSQHISEYEKAITEAHRNYSFFRNRLSVS